MKKRSEKKLSNYNLDVGINLDNRTIYSEIPAGTQISAKKYIAKTHNVDNYIAEENGTVYYQYGEEKHIFYDANNNAESFKLPEDFGTITEIDDTAVAYEYLSRASHEKVYVVSEDFGKQESMGKDQIKAEIDEQARSYGLPNDSVIGFDGETIPDGFEEIEGRKVATLYNASDVLNEGYQTKIKVDTLTSTTDLLTYADNSIVVGKGISKVLISGNVFAIKGQTDMSYLWTALRINRNGTEINVSFALDAERDGFACTSHSGFLMEVQEGDKIYLMSMIGQIVFFRGVHNTYLTVDVVE